MTATEFAAAALSAATGALPYLLGGVVAGFSILAVTTGVRVGLSALKRVGK